jgi:predicted phosphodiesterase
LRLSQAGDYRELPVRPPVLVLSDIHMAHPASYVSHPKQLTPLLDNVQTVIFNGDTCELAHLRRRAHALQLLADAVQLCEQRGVQPYFLTGNHDPIISNLHHLDLFGGRVFITHGDALHRAIAPWSWEAPAILAERRRLLAGRREPETLHETLHLSKQASLAAALYDHTVTKQGLLGRMELVSRFIRKPRRILITLMYWANVAHYSHALQERFRPDARLMIIGHTHRPGVWRNRDYLLVNTGSYQPLSHPLAVYLDENHAVVRRVRFRKGEYIPGSVVGRTHY